MRGFESYLPSQKIERVAFAARFLFCLAHHAPLLVMRVGWIGGL